MIVLLRLMKLSSYAGLTFLFCRRSKKSLGFSAMKAFYRSIGMPASIPELIGRKATEAELSELALKCSRGGSSVTGQFKPLTQADVLKVYAMVNSAD